MVATVRRGCYLGVAFATPEVANHVFSTQKILKYEPQLINSFKQFNYIQGIHFLHSLFFIRRLLRIFLFTLQKNIGQSLQNSLTHITPVHSEHRDTNKVLKQAFF